MSGKYALRILKGAQKDKEKIKQVSALRRNVEELLQILQNNPYQNPPPYEKLVGDI